MKVNFFATLGFVNGNIEKEFDLLEILTQQELENMTKEQKEDIINEEFNEWLLDVTGSSCWEIISED